MDIGWTNPQTMAFGGLAAGTLLGAGCAPAARHLLAVVRRASAALARRWAALRRDARAVEAAPAALSAEVLAAICAAVRAELDRVTPTVRPAAPPPPGVTTAGGLPLHAAGV